MNKSIKSILWTLIGFWVVLALNTWDIYKLQEEAKELKKTHEQCQRGVKS